MVARNHGASSDKNTVSVLSPLNPRAANVVRWRLQCCRHSQCWFWIACIFLRSCVCAVRGVRHTLFVRASGKRVVPLHGALPNFLASFVLVWLRLKLLISGMPTVTRSVCRSLALYVRVPGIGYHLQVMQRFGARCSRRVAGVRSIAPILTDALASETSLMYRLRSVSRAGGFLAQVGLARA